MTIEDILNQIQEQLGLEPIPKTKSWNRDVHFVSCQDWDNLPDGDSIPPRRGSPASPLP